MSAPAWTPPTITDPVDHATACELRAILLELAWDFDIENLFDHAGLLDEPAGRKIVRRIYRVLRPHSKSYWAAKRHWIGSLKFKKETRR